MLEPSIATPFFAAWMMAFASAWTVATQWPSSIMWPTSLQCGSPRIDPLYPVERIVLSRTSTAPPCLRSQVARVATTRAMFMKYSSQLTRSSIGPPGAGHRTVGGRRPRQGELTWRDEEDRSRARAVRRRRLRRCPVVHPWGCRAGHDAALGADAARRRADAVDVLGAAARVAKGAGGARHRP